MHMQMYCAHMHMQMYCAHMQVVEWQHNAPEPPEQSALVQEAALAVTLNHANVVRTFDFGIRSRKYYSKRVSFNAAACSRTAFECLIADRPMK